MPGDDRPISELVQSLPEQAVALIRKEVDMAREEMLAKAREAAPGAAMIGAGGVLGTLATGTATAGLVLLLARKPAAWGAALAVTGCTRARRRARARRRRALEGRRPPDPRADRARPAGTCASSSARALRR
jgi:hypothetical protein